MPDLGKYGVEVLSAYAVTIALLGGLIWATWRRSRAVRRALDGAEARRRDD
jgi:heme exporter protein D